MGCTIKSVGSKRSHAEEKLELASVLAQVAEFCRTGLGSEKVLSISPTFDASLIALRIEQTREAFELLRASEIPEYGMARDVRRSVSDAEKGAVVPAEELFRIGETLEAMGNVSRFFAKLDSAPNLKKLAAGLPYLPDLQKKIQRSISPEGEVLDDASPALKKIRSERNAQQRKLMSRLQSLISSSYRAYLQEPIYTVRDGRYVVPVKAQYKSKVPGIVHDASASGQTLFIEPQSIVEEGNRLRELEALEREETERILSELSSTVGGHSKEMLSGSDILGELDGIFAKARYADDRNAAPPCLSDGHLLVVREGHHPLIAREKSVPLTISVGEQSKSLLLSGPNTGGKTVTLKLLGLYALMIGCGIFPPAREVKYGPFRNVWADIGDEQSLQQSLSTFSAHLKNIAEIFEGVQRGDLVILDEIGAGTDPREGGALAKAFLDSLHNKGAIVAASTHYGEVKNFAQASERFACAAMEFDIETLQPTFRIIPGASGASHAMEISLRYGIPEEVIASAERFAGEEFLQERESSYALDNLVRETREEKHRIENLRKELEEKERRFETERQKWLEKMQKARAQMEESLAQTIREARERYRELLERLKTLSSSQTREEIISEAKTVEKELQDFRKRLEEAETGFESGAKDVSKIEPGALVGVRGYSQPGTVVEIKKGGDIVVQIGIARVHAKLSDLKVYEKETRNIEAPPGRRGTSGVGKWVRGEASMEITLRKMRFEDAKESLERFFDEAILAGVPKIRIVHGKGTGTLKKMVHDFLKSREEVEKFREGDIYEGGVGVTIVYLK